VSPDGSRVYATAAPTSAGRVATIDTTTNKVLDNISIGRSTTGVALSSDGAQLYVSNSDGTLAVIETATKNVAATVALTYAYTIASYYDNVNIPSRQVPAQDITVQDPTKGLVVSPDGKTAYVSTDGGPTFVVDLTANKISTVLSLPFSLIPDVSYPQAIAISPDGKTVYAPNTIYLDIVNTASFATTKKAVQDPLHGTQLAVSPDGKALYVAGYTKADGGYLEVVALT
jgi:YVTN family beta-propeller protein